MLPGRALARAGVLGMNRRNAMYVLRYNPRSRYPLVDDKLKTKKLCEDAGIPTAKLLAVAQAIGQLPQLVKTLATLQDFVLKPAQGAMGNGILVIRHVKDGRFQRSDDTWMDGEDLRFHASSIVSGLYALGGRTDVAIAEERLEVHPELTAICEKGVPDLRIIMYRGVPVMSMTRLPTRRSRGRANLHQGALGAGVDLASGLTIAAVLANRAITHHPDTGERVVGRPFPAFARALEIAVHATELTGLGYVGADVVVDANRGPVILELNARPGLAIQIANQAGLRPRLEAIDKAIRAGQSRAERIALGQDVAKRMRRGA
jgi:alpha-L-glutamate ligase-like protein